MRNWLAALYHLKYFKRCLRAERHFIFQIEIWKWKYYQLILFLLHVVLFEKIFTIINMLDKLLNSVFFFLIYAALESNFFLKYVLKLQSVYRIIDPSYNAFVLLKQLMMFLRLNM